MSVEDRTPAVAPDSAPVSEAASTLTLPLVWKEVSLGCSTLHLGGVYEIGEVMFWPMAHVWHAFGRAITNHRSAGYLDRQSAMAALEEAVKELEHGK